MGRDRLEFIVIPAASRKASPIGAKEPLYMQCAPDQVEELSPFPPLQFANQLLHKLSQHSSLLQLTLC